MRTFGAWKAVEYLGLALFLVIVPRMLGPEEYGRFAVLLSLLGLFTLATGLGTLATFARFVPEYEAGEDRWKTRVLFVQQFLVRGVFAAAVGGVLYLLLPLLSPGVSTLTAVLGAVALLCTSLAATCFQLFYGLNRLGRWRAQESLTRPLLILFLAVLGARTLEEATVAFFATQVLVLLLGLLWVRSYFTVRKSQFGLSFLRFHVGFGMAFFGANLLLMAVWRGGEVVVQVFSGDSTEVAYFSVASAVTMAFAALISELAAVIIPSLTSLHLAGEGGRKDVWLAYSLRYLTMASFLLVFAVFALGEWVVRLAVGAPYLPAASNLELLALALLPLAPVLTGLSLGIVHGQPKKALAVTSGALVTFILAAAVLVPGSDSRGASAAVALALASAGVIAYRQFSLGPVAAAARFWRLLCAGSLAMAPLLAPAIPRPLGGVLSVALFAVLLALGRVVSLQEIRRDIRALLSRPRAATGHAAPAGGPQAPVDRPPAADSAAV